MQGQLELIPNDKVQKNLSKENLKMPAIMNDIPFDKIYQAARKEASRKKPVFHIHKYFARRITSNFRMMLLGLLLPYDESVWDNFYNSFEKGVEGTVTVLDPFMGGGTTLFESCRLGCKIIGNDLQPLSNFVSRALISNLDEKQLSLDLKALEKKVGTRIKKYYTTECPECKQTADVMYNFHVKKVKTNSRCKEHKLYSSFVLSLKKDTFTLVCPKCGEVFKSKFEEGFAQCTCGYKIKSPKDKFVDRGVFKCEDCNEEKVISDYSKEEGYPFSTDIIAQEFYCPHCHAHDYKSVNENDRALYQKAIEEYRLIKDTLPIPHQAIPKGYNTNQILNHGYKKFTDLFNERQLLCLGLLLQSINEVENKESQFWLQLAFSGMLEMNNMFCRYQQNASKISNIFFNHAYVPITMPVENNVWGTKLGTGSFVKTLNKIIKGKRFNSSIYDLDSKLKNGKYESVKIMSAEVVQTIPSNKIEDLSRENPVLTCGDSRNLSHIKTNTVDIVLTDPPYGANIMYSELIDFFHVWNYMSSIGKELGFVTPMSPKTEEIIVNKVRNNTYQDYEDGISAVFTECNRVLTKDGFLVFSFHDKSLESWLSILKSIYNAGFKLVKAYPMHSESRTGAHTSNRNSIALDIMLISKKRYNEEHNELSDDIIKKISHDAYKTTEDKIKRLLEVEAEITIPDIENIYISEFFSLCSEYYMENNIFDYVIVDALKESLLQLDAYFEKYELTTVRTGWWSELYAEKWNIDKKS